MLVTTGLKVWKRIRYLSGASCDCRWREDSLLVKFSCNGLVLRGNKNKLWKKKNNPASSGTSSLERCTMTMIPEISARGSLIPAEPSTSPLRLNILSSHDSQWGRDLSAPKPFVTIPFQARSKPPVLLITMNRKNIHIQEYILVM